MKRKFSITVCLSLTYFYYALKKVCIINLIFSSLQAIADGTYVEPEPEKPLLDQTIESSDDTLIQLFLEGKELVKLAKCSHMYCTCSWFIT